MKSLFVTTFLIFALSNIKSQVVFCPPGAEWTYNFWFPIPISQEANEKIKYIKDSLIGTDTVKVLEHMRFYWACNEYVFRRTCIKQRGDTIFMRNTQTLNSWQILYNFSVLPGFTYTSTIRSSFYANASLATYTVVVDSINTITENGYILKQQFVRYFDGCLSGNPVVITERYGCSTFLFNNCNSTWGSCDADYLRRFLCYKDSTFGTKQFTTFPCDYSNPLGIDEYGITNNNFSLFPNPGSDNIEFGSEFKARNCKIEFADLSGRIVKQVVLDKNGPIDVRELEEGLYFLSVYSRDGALLGRVKFLKSQ